MAQIRLFPRYASSMLVRILAAIVIGAVLLSAVLPPEIVNFVWR